MTKGKVIASWTAVGCVVAACKSLRAFQTAPSVYSYQSTSNGGLRIRSGQSSSSARFAAATASDRSAASALAAIAATGVGAFASTAAVAGLYSRRTHATIVPRRQATSGVGMTDEIQVGETVKVKIWNGEWHAGVVTSTAPLKVKPNGWTDSHVFDSVMTMPRASSHVVSSPAIPVQAATIPTGMFDPSKQLGVTEPLGFFDPLGLSSAVDEEGFRHFRAAELKHGRIAMLAAVGCVVQHHIAIPGFEDVPRGLGAFETFPASPVGLGLVALASGYVEWFVWKEDKQRLPGDFGNPWCPIEGFEVSDDLRNKEINNGRLAMISIMGIIVAELASGRDGVEQIFGVST